MAKPKVAARLEGVARTPRAARRGTGGRPTREEAARRDQRLIEVATALFMERGFDGTSIEAVAETARVSKPTVYARYRDKRALFEAVLKGRIEGWLAPLAAAADGTKAALPNADAETTLHELSRTLLARATAPGAAALHRTLAAQAAAFPDVAQLAHEQGFRRGVRAVAMVFRELSDRGRIAVEDPEVAAEIFLDLVLGRLSRLALYDIFVDAGEQERYRRIAVDLFLRSVRPR